MRNTSIFSNQNETMMTMKRTTTMHHSFSKKLIQQTLMQTFPNFLCSLYENRSRSPANRQSDYLSPSLPHTMNYQRRKTKNNYRAEEMNSSVTTVVRQPDLLGGIERREEITSVMR